MNYLSRRGAILLALTLMMLVLAAVFIFHADPAVAHGLGGLALANTPPLPASRQSGAGGATEQLMSAFEEMSATVSERMDAIEARIKPIDRFLGGVVPAASRGMGVGKRSKFDMITNREAAPVGLAASDIANVGRLPVISAELREAEHSAIANFLRNDDDSGFAALGEFSAGMSVGSDPDGGYTVTPVLSSVIQQKTFDISPIGRLARKESIDGPGDAFEEPIDNADIEAKWVGETEERPALETAKLKLMRVPVNEIYTNQPVTQRLLDDSRFNIGGWLEGKIGSKFARTEGHAFIWGDGVEKPLGLLMSTTATTPDGERDWFHIQRLDTVATASITPDELIDLVYSLRAPYRGNARWLMNLKTAGYCRKMEDGEGNKIWVNPLSEGQPPLLLGFPVELDEEMPDIAADAFPIAFGDFAQAYIVVDKPGVKMLVDPYSNKPNVLLYAYRRVGGQVQNGEAVKLLHMLPS